MDKLNALFGLLLALSLATERIVETIKGLPILSRWFADEKTYKYEDARKASIQVLAIAVGTLLAYQMPDQLSGALGQKVAVTGLWVPLIFGAMASGGSGLWNSALDIVREVNKQKQVVTDKLKTDQAAVQQP